MTELEALDLELSGLEQEEAELQFTSFTNENAFELGMLLLDKAKQDHLKIVIDIERHGQQLFHYAMEGTTPDNDQWIIRKKNVVNRFNKSSYHVGLLLKKAEKTIEERYYVDPRLFAAHGGAFPIIIKKVGTVGTIAISGLPQQEDHRLVVWGIREYLRIEK